MDYTNVNVTQFYRNDFKNEVWIFMVGYTDEKNKIYAAIGDSGNVIYIDAKDEIVVAIASLSFKPSVHDRITFIQHNILPYLW